MNPVIVLHRAEASKEAYLSAIGLTGNWITKSDRVVDEEAFHNNTEEDDGEYASGSEPESDLHQDSSVPNRA